MLRKPYVLAIVISLMATSVSAKMYRWIDAQGQVVYSQKPPADLPVDEIKPLSEPNRHHEEGKKTWQQREEMVEAKKEKEAKMKKDATQKKRNKSNCKAARKNYETFKSHRARYLLNEDDQRVAVSDDLREQNLNKAKKQIAQYCS